MGGLVGLVLIVGAVGGTVVLAQDATPTASPAPWGHKGGPHGNGPRLGPNQLQAAATALGMTTDELSAQIKSGKTLNEIATAQGVDPKTVQAAIQASRPVMLPPDELNAAATALGMTTDDLSTELKSGKTLSDIAAEKGVDLQTVKDAMQTARNDLIRSQIKQAVTDGKMTQDKANWLLEGLDKGYLNGPGFGFGFGFDHNNLPGNSAPPAASP